MRHVLRLTVAALVLSSCSCEDEREVPKAPEVVSGRCEIDLTPWLAGAGAGVSAKKVALTSELIGGEAANGRVGDTLLQNDKVRFVIQQPGRTIAANPYGGALLDADFVRASGPGNDKFGKLAPFFNFGRTVDVKKVEVIASGEGGGPAVVAATGPDVINNYINIKGVIGSFLTGAVIQLDPDAPTGMNITTYYVLAPGKTHLSVLTAFCNPSAADLKLTAGDLIDSGGDVALLNPQSQTGGFGYRASPDATTWLSWLATDSSIAYGVAPWSLEDPNIPQTRNNSLTVAGVTGYIVGNKAGLEGIAEYLDAKARNRSGTVTVPAGGKVLMARDFVVGRDLGEVATVIEGLRAEKTKAELGDVKGVVTDANGPVVGARVVAERPDPDSKNPTGVFRQAVFLTDAQGKFAGTLPAGSYTFTAWKQGRTPSAPATDITLGKAAPANVPLTLAPSRLLSVQVKDHTGRAGPAKLTLRCTGGACAVPPAKLGKFTDLEGDPRPDDIQLIAAIPPSGTRSFEVPEGSYEAIVSRGTEWSLFPTSAPGRGFPVDLTGTHLTANVDAKLRQVIDTAGWMSADFHVHCVNSPDSPVAVTDRVETFLAEGVDVLLSTDHDFITDYAPTNRALGGDAFMATMIGEEITTFDYGHFNPFPVRLDAENLVNHGAVDWGDGEGQTPNRSIDTIIEKARGIGATTFQMNHPNGATSTFGGLLVNTVDRTTRTDPATVRLPKSERAKTGDTGLFPTKKWDAMELMNGFGHSSYTGLLNTWMTFNATGLMTTATAVSDTHRRWSTASGYPRSYVRMDDAIAAFEPSRMSEAVNAHKVTGVLGPFIRAFAFKKGSAPAANADVAALEQACTPATCAQVGDTLRFDPAQGIELVVDVQSPEWAPFDEIDVLDHRAAKPTLDGNPVSTFAADTANAPGVQKAAIALGTTETETVEAGDASYGCGQAACAVRRFHVQRRFTLDGASGLTGDDFLVVVARQKADGRDLMPVVFDGTATASGRVTAQPAKPFSFTNALFLDGDGNGYDKFPGVAQPASAKRELPAGTNKAFAAAVAKLKPTAIHPARMTEKLQEMLFELDKE